MMTYISIILVLMIMAGIWMMSKPQTAKAGNLLSALALLLSIIFTLIYTNYQGTSVGAAWVIYPSLIVGGLLGGIMAGRVKMIEMPQMVAVLNGFGGAASALVGILSVTDIGVDKAMIDSRFMSFFTATGYIAVMIGVITFIGSLVAAGKLHRLLSQKPVIWPFHSWATLISLLLSVSFVILGCIPGNSLMTHAALTGVILFSALFGLLFSIRVGGADMPITISLLNSFSGVAGSIAGMAIGDVLLVAIGGIVGASGLLLTQIMCKAMNRSLTSILLARTKKTVLGSQNNPKKESEIATPQSNAAIDQNTEKNPSEVLASAKKVIIVPGYGMALAQAQLQVKQLAEILSSRGTEVKFAIHPVAGRMPGHMNVLLAEANVSYDDLFQMEEINDKFAEVDAVVVIGANDVLNPAAREAVGTPIYGMPVLNVDQAPFVIICNYDLKPGYAGVENPLYTKKDGVALMLGDAKESLANLTHDISQL